ncbi:MAG: phosphatidylinositol-specific phospholipase C domain-containing protein [Christensenellales bacterium]|jgi:hypothetical protein
MKCISRLIIVAIILFSLVNAGGCARIDEDFYSEWMRCISDETLIIDTVIPGSHDAGSKGLLFFMDTQESTIYEQLKAGVRYFDMRAKYNTDDKLAMYHGAQTGALLSNVLDEIRTFIDAYPTEFLILDFQHFEGNNYCTIDEQQIDVEAMISAKLNPSEYALKKPVDLSKLTMKDIRDKGARYIIVWGRDNESALNKDYIFPREEYLCSPYNKPEHQEDFERLRNYFPNYYALNDGTKFFVLQCQPTSGNIKAFNDTHLGEMNAYVASIADDEELLNKTNIIMRDFIVSSPDVIRTILRLNLDKNTIDNKYIKTFEINLDN